MIFIVSFSILASDLEIYSSLEFYSLKRREISSIQWYSNFTSDQYVVIAEFGWGPIFIYYDYPFEEKNATRPLTSVVFFITSSNEYLNPRLHIQNGTNILIELKSDLENDVYLIVTDEYLLLSSLALFGSLTSEEMEMYYSLNYLNKIVSSKAENENEIPIYWVI